MIKTKRLVIRPYIPMDEIIYANVRWLNDPEVVRYSEQRHKTHTFESQLEYIKSFNTNQLLSIFLGDKFIGTMSVYHDDQNKVADVGIMIGDKSEWGQGFGFEAWQALCDGLLHHGIRKVEAGCMSTNWPMRSICKKHGMREEGSRWGHYLLDKNETADMLLFGKFK